MFQDLLKTCLRTIQLFLKGVFQDECATLTAGEVFVSGLRANTDEESVREIFKDMGLTTVKVCCEGKPDGQGLC